jgi:hypothetical protein
MFETSDTDFHIAEDACGINYADTCLLKRVHRLSKSQSLHRSTYEYGCVDMLELSTGFDQACLQIIGIRIRLALKSKLQWVLATFHNS